MASFRPVLGAFWLKIRENKIVDRIKKGAAEAAPF
jgi:hypothetical protein